MSKIVFLRKKAVVKKAIKVITLRMDSVTIYCFGLNECRQSNHNPLFPETIFSTKTVHLNLLVFAGDIPPNAVADIQNVIYELFSGQVTVTLLLHSIFSFKKASGNQMHFFWRVICLGNLVYYDERKSLGKEIPLLLRQDLQNSEAYWHERYTIAKSLLDAEMQMERSAAAVSQSMIHVAVGQICLGLIEVFLGYRPNHFALGYLLDICAIFSAMPNEVLPRDSEENKCLFAILTTNLSALRHCKSDTYSESDINILSARCTTFLEKSATLVNEHLTQAGISMESINTVAV